MKTIPNVTTHWIPHVLEALAVLVLAGLVVRGAARFIRRLETHGAQRVPQMAARRTTLYRLLTSVTRYAVDFIALITVLDLFGVPTTSLVAGAGVLGLAVSFGAQGLVQDVVTGLFLLYEDQFVVGDQITLPNLSLSGTVTEVGIRVTRLTGPTGEVVILPNRLILEVQNHSRGRTAVAVSIPVAPNEDPDRVQATLTALVNQLAEDMPGLSLQGITAFSPGQVTWSLTAPAPYGDAFRLSLALRREVARTLYQHGIMLAGSVKGTGYGPANQASI